MAKGRLRQVSPRGPALRFQFDPESVVPSGGVGGWNEIPRPRQETAVEWGGQPASFLTFTLLFDGFDNDESVEPQCRLLKNMGQRPKGGKQPPILEMDYGPVGRGQLWVIQSIDWGPELRNKQLERIRAEATVTLLQFNKIDIALSPTEKHKAKK